MKEIVLAKLKELDKDYDMWLRHYENEGLEYQEEEIRVVRAKISILNEILRESETKQNESN